MSTTGVGIGYGAIVRILYGDPLVPFVLKGPGDFDLPAAEAEEVEVTSHSSPGRTREFVPGMIDNGAMALPLDYVPNSDQDVLLRQLHRTGELVQVGVTPAGGTEELYAAFVKSYQRSAPVTGKATSTLNLRINGAVLADPPEAPPEGGQ